MTIAVFTQGSILRHILVMTGANTITLLALVGSDLVDMYFLSQLGEQELAAAIGFSGILLFILTSVGMGLQIAVGALVAKAEGQRDRYQAKRLCTHTMLFAVLVTTLVTIPTWFSLEFLLSLLGARGHTLDLAVNYCRIVTLTAPVLVCGMCAIAALRAVGDARRSTFATLSAVVVTLILDPLLIIVFEMGIQGAAYTALVSRVVLMLVGLAVLSGVHRFLVGIDWSALRADIAAIAAIAGPAMLTTTATPIGSAYVVNIISAYGDSAVAGAATLERIMPVALSVIFGLSTAVGPIIAQNAGADRYDRVKKTINQAVWLDIVYVLVIWALLFLLRDVIITTFSAEGEAAYLISFSITYLSGFIMFMGMLFIAIAGFNNLSMASTATMFNLARVFAGLFPLVTLGSWWLGSAGVLAGESAAALLWGSCAFLVLRRRVKRMAKEHAKLTAAAPVVEDISPMAYSSGVSQMGAALETSNIQVQRPDNNSEAK